MGSPRHTKKYYREWIRYGKYPLTQNCYLRKIIGVQETVLLVNHALARGTPAILVIFVVSRGSSSKALVLLVRMQIRHFRHFRQKPPFSGGTKAWFTNNTIFGTPNLLWNNCFSKITNFTCVIPRKSRSFLEISRAQNPPIITKNNFQGVIFVFFYWMSGDKNLLWRKPPLQRGLRNACFLRKRGSKTVQMLKNYSGGKDTDSSAVVSLVWKGPLGDWAQKRRFPQKIHWFSQKTCRPWVTRKRGYNWRGCRIKALFGRKCTHNRKQKKHKNAQTCAKRRTSLHSVCMQHPCLQGSAI